MKTFKQISEMSMSVTLKPKKNNMYKVTGVGKKMAAHGGIKKGEKFHDSEIDGMNDSGIKVKYEKPKKMKEHIVQEVKMPEDGKAYMVKNCGCLKDPCDEYGSIKEQIKNGEAKMKPVEEDMMPGEGKATVKGGKLRMQRTMDKHGVQQQKPPIKGKVGKFKKVGESIQRRMDRMTIIATDPATGRKVVKVAPKKEIDIGKGKMEAYVAEISDKMKMNYITKANKQISKTEKMRDYQNQQMDKKPGSFTKSDKDFVNKMYDKDTLKRRKGVRMAKSKLGEGAFKEMDTVKKEKQRLARMKKPEYSKKEIRMGKGVAFDKRYKQGNYSGAYKTINKIKKGLADHPKVADALKRANEQFIQGE